MSRLYGLVLTALVMLNMPFMSKEYLATADFMNEATYTQTSLWQNMLGIVLNYPEVAPYLNSIQLKRYMLNSNIKGSWVSNWAPVIRIPKGYHYECSMMSTNSSATNCIKEFKDDPVFFSSLGSYIWDTTLQPFWTFGINNEFLDWNDPDLRGTVN